MTGEFGGYRRQITHLGDVLNTTARLEALCKELQVEALVSEAASQMVNLPERVSLKDAGSHRLKGIEEPIKVFSSSPA